MPSKDIGNYTKLLRLSFIGAIVYLNWTFKAVQYSLELPVFDGEE